MTTATRTQVTTEYGLNRMTQVFNLSTGEERFYMLAFNEAVICAWMNSVGKNNTWQYDFSKKVPLSRSGRTACMSDWCCVVPAQERQ